MAAPHLERALGALLASGEVLPDRASLTPEAAAGAAAPWAEVLGARGSRLVELLASAAGDLRAARRLLRELEAVVAPELRRARQRAGVALVAALALAAVGVMALAGRTTAPVGEGFHGRYYPRRDFAGEAQVRVDPRIDFSWLGHAPMSGLPRDQFSVRWDGCFELDEAAELQLRVGSDDGSRVFLDGAKVIDNWRDQGGNWMARSVSATPGRHHLRVEYYERGGDAFVVFELTRDGAPVPDGFVRPPAVLVPEVSCDAP